MLYMQMEGINTNLKSNKIKERKMTSKFKQKYFDIIKHTFLPSWVRQIAIDKDGRIFGYSNHPEITSSGGWLEKEGSINRWKYFWFPDNQRLKPEDWTETRRLD